MKVFKDMVNKIYKIAIFLRKPTQVKVIKKICPEPIVTRWQYIFDKCIFLGNNIDIINQILNLNEKSTCKLDFGIDFFHSNDE